MSYSWERLPGLALRQSFLGVTDVYGTILEGIHDNFLCVLSVKSCLVLKFRLILWKLKKQVSLYNQPISDYAGFMWCFPIGNTKKTSKMIYVHRVTYKIFNYN